MPEARIDASPDLDFRIAGREIMVKGEVKVPLARIQPADLTNAVLPSADERLVGPTEEVEKDPFRVTSEITMTLGDKVTIDTYGLVGTHHRQHHRAHPAGRAHARHRRIAGQGRHSTPRWRASSTSSAAG